MLYPLSYERMSTRRTVTPGDNLKTIPALRPSPRRAGCEHATGVEITPCLLVPVSDLMRA